MSDKNKTEVTEEKMQEVSGGLVVNADGTYPEGGAGGGGDWSRAGDGPPVIPNSPGSYFFLDGENPGGMAGQYYKNPPSAKSATDGNNNINNSNVNGNQNIVNMGRGNLNSGTVNF